MNRIAVLGSNSFAGSQFIHAALQQDVEVLGLNRSAEQSDIFLPYKHNPYAKQYQFKQLDINGDFDGVIEALDRFRPQVVVDFAGQGMVAESWVQPEQWYQTNIVAKVKLHNYLKSQDWLEKYIRVSTPEVYGSCDSLITEEAQYNPSTPYAVSHAAIDMSLRAFHTQYGFPVVFSRFSNFYGAGQQLYRIIPRTIIYARTGRVLDLHGGGVAVRAFIHGSDVAGGLLRCMDKGQNGQTYHFSTDSFISIRELVELIHRKMGVDTQQLTRISQDRPGKDLQYLMDDTKAKSELGWEPRVALEQGIEDCINWVDQNLAEISNLPLEYIHKA